MKKIIISFLLFFNSFSIFSQQEENSPCLDNYEHIENPIPDYLQPWWGNVWKGRLAVVYADFPDGRWNDNGVLRQPHTNEELAMVANKDAAGEAGVIKNENGQFEMKALKYSYYDRWDMLFDSVNNYVGLANPDYYSHGDLAYGSMKQYWKEASNGKYDLIPFQTRTPNTNIDHRLWRGIVNDFEMVNGVPFVKSIMLPKNKYGSDAATSYLRSYEQNDSTISDIGERMMDDAILAATNLGFNVNGFIGNGGVFMVVFSGSHSALKGLGRPSSTSTGAFIVREKTNQISDLQHSTIDGFGITAHEFGHLQFNWGHANSSRYCIMNANSIHHKDCPQLPNPIFRLQKGWLNPIPLENSQQNINIQPIETSFQCGVVTIYGKPIAAPNWTSGEYYVVENRKLIGFDRFIVSPPVNDFNGGLLIWHYSPYKDFNNICLGVGGFDDRIKLITANRETSICIFRGNAKHFYAYLPNIDPDPNDYYNIFSERTFSADNKKTGIELRNIQQVDYNNINSPISFNLNYTISEPTVYDYVIYNRGLSNRKVIIQGKAFYHEPDRQEFYKILPGAVIDVVTQVNYSLMEARGTVGNMITFRGPRYSNSLESHISSYNKGINIPFLNAFDDDIDSMILVNVNIQNTNDYVNEISCKSTNINTPLILENINVTSNFNDKNDYDILVQSANINGINISNAQILMRGGSKFYSDVYFTNSRICSHTNSFFAAGKRLVLINSKLDNIINNNLYLQTSFDKIPGSFNWGGIVINGGGIDLGKASNNVQSSIKNSYSGIDISNSTTGVKILNTTFENNRDYDIVIYKPFEIQREEIEIKGNTFTQNVNDTTRFASIILNECHSASVDSNIFTNTGYFGIVLMNSKFPLIKKNIITGRSNSNLTQTGIFSYNSGGNFICNKISQFTRNGIELDNSQPSLLNNEIYVNGIGLYLTNNSNPIMAAGYLPTKSFVVGGYNWIHNNASQEIYLNNSKYNYNIPYMYKGFNAIEDLSVFPLDTLIYNKDTPFGNWFPIDVTGNYWGGSNPSGRLIPDNSFIYNSFQNERLYSDCNIVSDIKNNSTLPQWMQIFGEELKSQFDGDYNSSISYSQELLLNYNTEINPIISLNNLFSSTLADSGNFTNLENYYLSQIALHPNDTVLSNKSKNLAIESKIEQNEIEPAISEYEEIINSSNEDELKFYASIDKNRAIRLLLESILSHYGEDNFGWNLNPENLFNEALVSNLNSNMFDSKISEQSIETKKSQILSQNIPNSDYKKLNELQNRVTDKIKNINNLNDKEKLSLITEKNIVDIALKNYVIGVASLDSKLRFLTKDEVLNPNVFKLYQNYPNPFNPVTKISFEIPFGSITRLKIYDMLGREIKSLINEFKDQGNYTIEFDGSNLASGVYFYKLVSGDFTAVKRMVLVK